jgi:hypothetical protein
MFAVKQDLEAYSCDITLLLNAATTIQRNYNTVTVTVPPFVLTTLTRLQNCPPLRPRYPRYPLDSVNITATADIYVSDNWDGSRIHCYFTEGNCLLIRCLTTAATPPLLCHSGEGGEVYPILIMPTLTNF